MKEKKRRTSIANLEEAHKQEKICPSKEQLKEFAASFEIPISIFEIDNFLGVNTSKQQRRNTMNYDNLSP